MRQILPEEMTMVAMREKSTPRNAGSRSEAGGGGQIVTRAKETATDVVHSIQDGARVAKESLTEMASEASRAIGQTLKDEGERLFEKQKSRIVSRIRSAGTVAGQVA